METELWKSVPGYDASYQVSNLGRARRALGDGFFSPLGRKYQESRPWYKLIRILNDSGKPVTVSLHSLVCLAFIGPKPSLVHQVNHKNGSKVDNRADNLEWVTSRENRRHAIASGLWHPSPSKLTPEQREACRDYSRTAQELATQFGVSAPTISRIRIQLRKR